MDAENMNYLIGETDALKWAEAFGKMIKEEEIKVDEGLMLGWFANAIMSGYDAGVKHERERDFMEKLHEIIYQAAGAATGPFMEANPQMVFPDRHVIERIEFVLREHGIPPREREERVDVEDSEVLGTSTS